VTRALFIARLRDGLRGLPAEEIGEIAADYDAHFRDAVAAGRAEADVATSLGDPVRLGHEIRVETKLRRWEQRRNPRTFMRAGAALLPVFSLAILLPVIAGLLLGAGLAAYVLYIVAVTGLHLMAGLLSGNGNVLVPAMVGAGLLCGVVGFGALIALLLDSGMRLVGGYVRVNYRLLKPDDMEAD
jgi:uncharacterized membrane protein